MYILALVTTGNLHIQIVHVARIDVTRFYNFDVLQLTNECQEKRSRFTVISNTLGFNIKNTKYYTIFRLGMMRQKIFDHIFAIPSMVYKIFCARQMWSADFELFSACLLFTRYDSGDGK